jgi:hypothetical protein
MLLFWAHLVFAETEPLLQRLYLNDGSVLTGELVSFDGNAYFFSTESMGEIKVAADRVQSLETITATAVEATTQPSSYYSQFSTTPKKPRAPAVPKQPRATAAMPSVQNTPGATDLVISSMQNVIMQDEKLMGLVLQLQNDPSLIVLMSDPQVMQAIQTGDMETLEKHPAMQKLMNTPEMKEIQGQLEP